MLTIHTEIDEHNIEKLNKLGCEFIGEYIMHCINDDNTESANYMTLLLT